MPVRYDDQRRHSSYLKPNEFRYSATLDSVYDGSDSDSSRRTADHYRSSPALNMDSSELRPYDRYRYGSQEAISIRSDSIDSLDTSSRKSDHSRQSSGSDTFSFSKTGYRRSNSSNTPKPPADPLQFVKVVSENPLAEKAKKVAEVMDKQKKEKKSLQTSEDDWQTDLSAWKSKMRRKSANTYVRALEADEDSKKDEDPAANRRNKTFKEMMEEKKERRKSYNIYPFGDDEEATTFKKPEKVAEPARTSIDDKLDEFGFVKVDVKSDPKEKKLNKWRGSSTNDEDKLAKWKSSEQVAPSRGKENTNLGGDNRESKWRSRNAKTSDETDSKIRQWKSQESLTTENKFSKWRQREKDGEEDFKRESSPAFKSEIPKQDRFSRWRHAEKNNNDEVFKPETRKKYTNDDEIVASWTRSSEAEERRFDSNKENKTPSIGKRWEQQFGAPEPEVKPTYKSPFERTPHTTQTYRSDSYSDNSSEDKTSSTTSPRQGDVEVEEVSVSQISPRRRYGAVEKPEKSEESHRRLSSSDVPQVRQDENKGTYVEKSVKVNAKPESTKGFGFTIKGGKESGAAITIEKVSIGSPADVCELLAGDEIVSINGAEVGHHYKESVMHVITQAITSGVLDLRIRRYISSGADEDFLEEPEDFSPPRSAPQRFEPELKSPEPEVAEESLENADVSATEHQGELEDKTEFSGGPQVAPGEESEESFCSDDEAFERQIMEQLEREAVAEAEAERLHELTLQEDDLARQESLQEASDDGDDDAPPPIPSEPPPAPNWSTFPSAAGTDEDLGDILPEANHTLEERSRSRSSDQGSVSSGNDDRRKSALDSLESTMRIRVDALRRRSEYLGTNLEDMEEYRKIQAEMERDAQRIAEREQQDRRSMSQTQPRIPIPDSTPQEENVWQQIEKKSEMRISSPVSSTTTSSVRSFPDEPKPTDLLWQRIEEPHRNLENNNDKTNFGTGTFGYKSEYDLEQAEREIIENLEREEKARTDKSPLPPWRDSERNRKPTSGYRMEDVEARVAKDMEITMESRPDKDKPIRSSMRFFDFEEDQKKMEEWNKENERRIKPTEKANYKVETQITLQERFERDQDDMRRRYEDEKRQADAILEEKRKKEDALMEKERAHQRELEAMRVKQEAERERRMREEEARRQKMAAEAEERRKQQEAEFARLREIEAEEERLRQEEADLQKKIARKQIHVERDKSPSPSRPHGEYTFTFAVNSQGAPNTSSRKAPWQRDNSEERQQRDVARKAEERKAQQEADQREAERRQQEERSNQLQREREAQMEAMMRQGSGELSSTHQQLFGNQEQHQQAWSDRGNPGYPYRPTEAPVSQLNDYTSPLKVDVGRQPYQPRNTYEKNDEYSRPNMEHGYGYQELSRPLKGVRDPASSAVHDDGPRPQFNVEIGASDPSRRLVVDRGSSSPKRDYYSSDNLSRSKSESSLKYTGGYSRPGHTYPEPSKYSPSSNTPEIVARRDVMEKHPSRGYSPDSGRGNRGYSPESGRGYSPESNRYNLPQTSRSKDEITVKRPTIDWNKNQGRKEEVASQQRDPPTSRYGQSLEAGRQNPRLVKLNTRPTVPRPDDYWMRDSNGPTSPPARGGSREEVVTPRKSWLEDSQDSAYRSRTDSNSSSSRRSLHNLSATPKQRIISGNDWIVSDEERKRQEKQQRLSRHGEIMRQHIPNTSDHWLVEEAERRRRADRSGQDRPNIQNWNTKKATYQGWRH